MAGGKETFEQISLVYPEQAYNGVVDRLEAVLQMAEFQFYAQLSGRSGKTYEVVQVKKSMASGGSYDCVETVISTAGQTWRVKKGTGNVHKSITDDISFVGEGPEGLEVGQWAHFEYRRNRKINVSVFKKFDELFTDLESPQLPGLVIKK